MEFLIKLHSGWRFFILLAAICVIIKMTIGIIKSSEWTKVDNLLGLIYIILLLSDKHSRFLEYLLS